MTKLTVGCDPELWLRDKTTGEIVSAHNLLPGSKLEPFKVPRGAIQVDGTAAEFNITPAATYSTFVSNIAGVLSDIKERLPNHELVYEPVTSYKEEYFYSLPEVARELGCNPDYNAWTGVVNPAPEGSKTTMRTASGHIHVGWCEGVNPQDPIHIEDCNTVVKQLDYYLGLYSLLWDKDNTRRQLYGKAGACRYKPYGVEYRVMSNVWLRSTDVQVWIFNAATKAVNDLLKGGKSMEDQFGDYARNCIDNNIEWWKDDKGQKVHLATDLKWPNYQSCFPNYKVEQLDKKSVKTSVRKKASFTYQELQI